MPNKQKFNNMAPSHRAAEINYINQSLPLALNKESSPKLNSYTHANNTYNNLVPMPEINKLYNHMINSFFNFEIDNKGLNKNNKLGLRKIFYSLKLFRYFRYSGVHTGQKQIITYNYIKNNSRTNTINSLDHTGSLLKLNISVILKYFFKLMGLGLISKPIFIFNNNKITIQISYFINKKIFFVNNKTKSSLLHLMKNAAYGDIKEEQIDLWLRKELEEEKGDKDIENKFLSTSALPTLSKTDDEKFFKKFLKTPSDFEYSLYVKNTN